MTLPIGTEVVNLTITKILKHGNHGVTYLAVDEVFREFIIKEYFPSIASRYENQQVKAWNKNDENNYNQGLKQFISISKEFTLFNHPNINRVFKHYELNNTAYAVMEFLGQGRSLETALLEMEKKGEEVTQIEVHHLVHSLANALATMHSNNTLHRGISPENIFIQDQSNQAVLLDFSFTQYFETTRSIHDDYNSGYTPIEQFQRTSTYHGSWTDIYALAATIYRVITSKTPVDAWYRLNMIDEGKVDPLLNLYDYKKTFGLKFLDAIFFGLNLEIDRRPKTISEWSDSFE